jgi:hypothetical protein
MRRTRKEAAAALFLLAAVGFGPGRASAESEDFDPKADRLTKRMSDYLASLETFRFVADHITEVVLDTGQKIQLGALSDVKVKRPNMLKSRRLGQLVADATLFYDGKNITIFGGENKYYATAPAPATLDEAVDFAGEKLNLETPAGDLVVSNVYRSLTRNALGSTYIGKAIVDGTSCDHVAYRGKDTDIQLWIQDGDRPLPMKYVITSKNIPQSPEFSVMIREWDTDADLSNEKFTFVPPLGAQKIEFLALAKEAEKRAEK